MPRSMVLDGEIVCIDDRGHCHFNDLLFRRGEPCFVAFDLLDSGGRGVRHDLLWIASVNCGGLSVAVTDYLRGSHRGPWSCAL
jgi:hypothetical protein